MPIETKYINDGTGVELIGQGNVTGEEICHSLNEIYSGETLIKQKYQFWYFVDLESFNFPKKDFKRMVELDMKASKVNPDIIIAIVGN